MLNRRWRTINEEEVPDVLGLLRTLMSSGVREVHVGSDSQQTKSHTEFVTVVVVLEPGKGGRAFYSRERTPRVKSLRERLLREVWMSVEVGLQLNSRVPETVGLTIHVDANPDLRFRSSDHVKELTSLIVSQGFRTFLKPDAWCASRVADHVVRQHVSLEERDDS